MFGHICRDNYGDQFLLPRLTTGKYKRLRRKAVAIGVWAAGVGSRGALGAEFLINAWSTACINNVNCGSGSKQFFLHASNPIRERERERGTAGATKKKSAQINKFPCWRFFRWTILFLTHCMRAGKE